MPRHATFAAALTLAREATRMSKSDIAREIGTYPNTVYRWERHDSRPSMEVRIRLLQILRDAPRPLLESLAAESEVDLVSIGLTPPAPPPPPVPAVAPAQPAAIPASAQAMVDDALREAAEEIDVTPKLLRPAMSRMLDRLARGGVPIDAAARMVLGVPKKAPSK